MFISGLVFAVLFSQAVAQSCPAASVLGPCLNGVCAPTFTCITSTQECCPDVAIVPDPTSTSTATTVTVATDSSGNNITTVASTYVTSSVTTTCVDKVNPSTGVSDCAAQASLCNDATYYAVMTVQCPKTCGRCSSSTSYSSTCVDKINPSTGVSDCSALAYLCTNTAYTTLMTAQCPRTCNLCSYNSTATTVSSSCVDKLNPTTGVSDCAQRVSLCTDSNYTALMRVQCPRTCGFCSSTGSTVTVTGTATTTTACVDAINPSTGISDCSSRVALCTNSSYLTLMRTQCPKTCGFC